VLKDNNYLTILPFMVRDLGLSGSMLMTYAVIYSFSQDGESAFSGSVEYIAEWAGITERNVRRHLEGLEERGLIVIEKRAGFTSKYRVNPDAAPGRNADPSCAKPADPPVKLTDDIDLSIDPHIPKKKNSGFCFPETAKTKEDAQTVFLQVRALWNEKKLAPECRNLFIPPSEYDVLQTFRHYTPEEIKNAVKNFDWHRSGRCGPGWKPPPPYKSLYGFLKTGVAQYFDDAALDVLFREEPRRGTG
jgi:hypothetical protein